MLIFTLTVVITFSVNSLYGLIAGAKVLQFSAFANVFKSFFESFLQVVGLMIFATKDFFGKVAKRDDLFYFSPDCSGNPFWIPRQRKQMRNPKRLKRKAGTRFTDMHCRFAPFYFFWAFCSQYSVSSSISMGVAGFWRANLPRLKARSSIDSMRKSSFTS